MYVLLCYSAFIPFTSGDIIIIIIMSDVLVSVSNVPGTVLGALHTRTH